VRITDFRERKLRIPVRCTTRKFFFTLRQREETIGTSGSSAGNQWHQARCFRSAGTKEIAAAKRIAAQIIESFLTHPGRGADARTGGARLGASMKLGGLLTRGVEPMLILSGSIRQVGLLRQADGESYLS